MDFYNQYMVHSLFPRGIIILQGVLTNLVEILMKIDKKYMYVSVALEGRQIKFHYFKL